MKLQEGVEADATFSPCGHYRYALTRAWSAGGTVLWVMLNPSSATAQKDDPTLRKVQGFSRLWGFGRLLVANLFALRATRPSELLRHPEPVGEANDATLMSLAGAAETEMIVVAWGAHGVHRNRGLIVRDVLLAGVDLWCLGTTSAGQPQHPLYLPAETERKLLR